jgi:hypothetical protein
MSYKKCFTCSKKVLIMKSLSKVEWDLKIISNLIQKTNDYGVENETWIDRVDILHAIIYKLEHS